MKKRFFILITFFVLLGCGYTIQGKQNLPFESIAIGEIKNNTNEPKLQDKMTSVMKEVFMTYGFSINQDARFIFEGEIRRYNLRVLSEISLSASEYAIDIDGDFRLIDRMTNKVYPLKLLKPFLTHFNTRQRLTEVLIQKEQFTYKALQDVAQEITRDIIYNTAHRQ